MREWWSSRCTTSSQLVGARACRNKLRACWDKLRACPTPRGARRELLRRQWSRLQAPQRRAACVAWRRRTSVMQQSLKGKVIVITGASSGFGKGAAMELARQGANVVLAARRSELLDELARDCKAAGGEA